ncbi:hypothetical protein [Rhodanobacter glycinis]|nr:hypothetical protein [Rhodanobacter glycinis]
MYSITTSFLNLTAPVARGFSLGSNNNRANNNNANFWRARA